MERDVIDKLYRAAGDRRVIVHTLSEARATIESATEPTIVQFPSLSLGAEHAVELRAICKLGLSKHVVVEFDEADLMQTTEQRIRSTTAVIKDGARRN